jgi:hypothetical protein
MESVMNQIRKYVAVTLLLVSAFLFLFVPEVLGAAILPIVAIGVARSPRVNIWTVYASLVIATPLIAWCLVKTWG